MDYKEASDIELFQYCRKDDIRAYNELFSRYSSRLYRQARRYITDDYVAEELMLDLLFDLWSKRNERNIQGDLSAYLYRAMRNKIVDYRRKLVAETIPIEQTSLSDTLEDQQRADYGLAQNDMHIIYKAILETMPPQRKRVFQLSREEELSYAEIAQEMRLSINTVENYVSSALETFRSRGKEYLFTASPILYVILSQLSLL